MFGINFKLILVMGVMLLAFLWYWDYSQGKIETLTAENATYKSALETQTKTIQKLQEKFELAQKELLSLNKKYEDIRKKNNELLDLLTPVTPITDENKEEIENTINKTLNDIFENLQKETSHSSF